MLEFLCRFYSAAVSPPGAPKKDDALRFGLLGAANITPMALILPAKSHAEVIIACVAARDRVKAEAYAKKHGIPKVHDTYDDVLNDPSISCVYIALPNGLHYEWTLRAIKAGKHVLLEKPSTSNANEAKKLFNHRLVTAPDAPVLLEAFHYQFHPAWQTFVNLIHSDPLAGPVKKVYSQQYLHKGYVPIDDIRFLFNLAGGNIMDFGTYPISCMRQVLLRDDPHPQVQDVKFRLLSGAKNPLPGQAPEQIDEAVSATYKTKSGAEGHMVADIRTTGGWPLLPASWTRSWPGAGWPKTTAELAPKQIDSSSPEGETHHVQRTVTIFNHLFPVIYHSIVVEDKHTIRDHAAKEVRSWTDKKTIKAYDWPQDLKKDGNHPGADWWTTYRYQLEEFVNRVKGRKGSGVWVDGQESITQMEVIDETYVKGGLKVRPGSEFVLE